MLNSKIKLFKKISWYTKMLCATEYPGGGGGGGGYAFSQINTEMGYPIPNNLF